MPQQQPLEVRDSVSDEIDSIYVDVVDSTVVDSAYVENEEIVVIDSASVSTEPSNNLLPITVNGVTFNMIKVDGGTFTMGGTYEQGNSYGDEKPTHQVTLSSYYIGETEVTQELWKAVMGNNPSNCHKGDNLPVEYISWKDCQKFISKLNKKTNRNFRLPTEAEWEYAARGGNKSNHTQYSGSSNLDDVGWYEKNSGGLSHPVKTKKANELGIYDMTGNVSEWCQDWYGNYSGDAQANPIGPNSGVHRVLRGGCFIWNAELCRLSGRVAWGAGSIGYSFGFRLALSE